MKNFAEFSILGCIGKIEPLSGATRISIASNYRRRRDDGQYADDPHWNTVVVFSESARRYIDEHVAKGDLVLARGRVRESRWEKDGETRYGVDLVCFDFARLSSRQPENGDAAE